MNNNDILRRLRYALNIKDEAMIALFKVSDIDISREELLAFYKKEEDYGFEELQDNLLDALLDNLITVKRGKREDGKKPAPKFRLNNNIILRKLKIALNLKDTDMIEIIKEAGFNVSKSELGALFRRPDHAKYKRCGDQFLRNFLQGLAQRTGKKIAINRNVNKDS